MPTGIDELWKALEAAATSGKAGLRGWLIRLVRPEAGCPLFAAVEHSSRRRAVLLRLPRGAVPARRLWPRCKGLEPLAVELDSRAHFGVVLKEPRFADVFTALAEDLTRRVSEAASPADQARAFLGQLGRWQKFLSVSQEGLTEEQQRGLWGELHFLCEHLVPALGPMAVSGWKGGEQAHQDFQFPTGAVEVKTTLAKQPQIVRIASERQLDDAAWPALFLQVIVLETLESGGTTLPTLVAMLRAKLMADATALESFEDELLAYGYLDAHVSRYTERGYLVRAENLFQVKSGFPRVTERDLPVGIGDVGYGLAVAACESFATKPSLALAKLDCQPISQKQKKRNA